MDLDLNLEILFVVVTKELGAEFVVFVIITPAIIITILALLVIRAAPFPFSRRLVVFLPSFQTKNPMLHPLVVLITRTMSDTKNQRRKRTSSTATPCLSTSLK